MMQSTSWTRPSSVTGPDGPIGSSLLAQGRRHGEVLAPAIDELKLWHAAGLCDRLPPQTYHLATALPPQVATHFVLGWLVGAYKMSRYRTASAPPRRAALVPPVGIEPTPAILETAALPLSYGGAPMVGRAGRMRFGLLPARSRKRCASLGRCLAKPGGRCA